MGVGFTFSIFDAIKINPERLWKLYILATVGMGIDKNGYIVDNYGNICYMANAGIGFSYRIAEKWTASLESSVYLPGDLGKPWNGGFKGYYIYNSLSLAYNFGVTSDDALKTFTDDILTNPVNMTGLPALSMPVGFNSENLPIGMHIIGAALNEATIYSLGYFLEQKLNLNTNPEVK